MASCEENLGQGLILRTVRDERDIERYVAFNTVVHGQATGITCDHLLRYHPEICGHDFAFVEDEACGEVVSTTCLIPWHCSYEGIILDVAMLEMVVTRPEYRHRGLIRAQMRRFHERVRERGCDLEIIEGIPYYYRQYGYTYCVDHRASDSLPTWRIPDQDLGEPCPIRLREASPDDSPLLARLYREAMATLPLHMLRGEVYWRFLLERQRFPAYLVEDARDGRVLGYICTNRQDDGRRISVFESAITSSSVGLAVLRQLKAEGVSEVTIGWPQSGTLVQIGRGLGSVPLPAYQWLLSIPDVAQLLGKVGPVLECRLAASAFASLSADLCLNLYRQGFMLRFREGRLTGVERIGFVDASMGAKGGHLNLPPEAFVRLLFGYRSLDELRDAWPDIVVRPESRYLVQVLFPKMASFFCMPYMYPGPVAETPA